MNASVYIIPCIIIIVIVYSLIKRQKPYNDFVAGAADSISLVKGIYPYLIAIFFMVQIFRLSGLSELMSKAFSPILFIFGIPPELSELVLIRPFSGSGSLAILNEVYLLHGVDSYIGRCASVVMGSSETVFYVSAVYFSSLRGKGLVQGIAISLLANNIGAGIGCLLCRVM